MWINSYQFSNTIHGMVVRSRRMIGSRGLLCFSLVVSLGFFRRAEATLDHEYGTWLTVFAQGNFNSRFSYYADAHVQLFDNFALNQILLRPAIGFRFYTGMHIWAGYGWAPSYPRGAGKHSVDEYRPWQQFTWAKTWRTGIRTLLRMRIEERIIEGHATVSIRYRQLMRVLIPIAFEKRLGIVIWDEPFFNLNNADVGIESGFNQNRALAGVAFQFNKTARLEVGYMNQILHRPGNSELDRHVLNLAMFLEF